jgi:hypothetical protein
VTDATDRGMEVAYPKFTRFWSERAAS